MLRAEIVRELLVRGLTVFAFNQRSVIEIEQMMLTLARISGVPEKGGELVESMSQGLRAIAASSSRFPRRPRVFFEEWSEPLISGIRWVEELVEIAGGEPVFPELHSGRAGKERIVDAGEVARRNPEVVIASWCGRKVNKAAIRARPGWSATAAVASNRIYEIKSTYILQPGPAALTEGVRQLHAILAHCAGVGVPPELAPAERTDPDLARQA